MNIKLFFPVLFRFHKSWYFSSYQLDTNIINSFFFRFRVFNLQYTELETKFCQHSPFGRVRFKMHSLGVIFALPESCFHSQKKKPSQ